MELVLYTSQMLLGEYSAIRTEAFTEWLTLFSYFVVPLDEVDQEATGTFHYSFRTWKPGESLSTLPE